jgi:signal transduction histidine kinase
VRLHDQARRSSIALRLAFVAAVAILTLALAGALSHRSLTGQLAARVIDPQLEAAANAFLFGATADGSGGLVPPETLSDGAFEKPGSGRYLQLLRIDSGLCAPVWAAPSLEPRDSLIAPGLAERACARADRGPFQFAAESGTFRVLTRSAIFENAEGRYLVVVAADPAPESRALGAGLAAITTMVVGFAGLLVALTALMLALVGAWPLRRLADEVAAVRRGQRELLSDDHPRELAPLAQELNALVAHNQEVVERARRHVGNLAHALKTPIAVLRNATRKGGETADLNIAPAVEEMERFVERQLRRARVAARAEAAAGASIAYRTPVAANLQDLIFMMEQKYDAKAVDLRLEIEAEPTFRGEREDLLEMAANLIDNACKYGMSEVLVRLTAPSPDLVRVTVEDDGPGLSDVQVEAAMQRGARLDEAAPGQGLGLSILIETVELYKGQLRFGKSATLGGLCATLDLPAVD